MESQKNPIAKRSSSRLLARLWRNLRRSNTTSTVVEQTSPNNDSDNTALLEYHNPTLGITDFKKSEVSS